MKILSMCLENFGSFKQKQIFEFPQTPGLYFMQGVNEVEPALGENGTGKSTLWKALCWCFFAKTSEGLAAGDVSSWSVGKNTSVSVMLELNDGNLASMTRTWSPNSWKLEDLLDKSWDLTKDLSNPVLQDLRLEFLPFLNSILTAQGEPMFLDMKSDAQASLFSEVMGLNRWLDFSQRASKKASDVDSELRVAEKRLAEARGAAVTPTNYTELIQGFQQSREERVGAVSQIYTQRLAELRKAKEALTDGRAFMLTFEEVTQARVLELQQQRDRADKTIATIDLKLRGLSHEDGLLEADRKLLKFLQSHEHCPTCDSDLDPGWKKTRIAALKKRVGLEEDSIHSHEGLLAQERTSMERVRAGAESALRASQEQTSTAWSDLNGRARSVALLEQELDKLEDDVESLQAEECPYIQLQEKERERASRQRSEVRTLTKRVDRLQERYSLFSYWVRGFKEIRLQHISSALVELEIEVNSCIAALGLVSWEIRFDVDRETKSGTIKRGFNVGIVSPHNAKPVPWASWSGGEKQRLRLAGTMGLANLIRSRTGCSLPLEVWDEPATALGGQGVQDLLEALASRASVEQRVIWLIDHTAHSFGSFAGGAVVTKKLGGSIVEQKKT
jgi:DNA repair exonuclease SbcCD ATPase subunit